MKLRNLRLTLVQKFLLLSFIGFAISITIITFNYLISLKLENNAVAINFSGQARYRAYELYYRYDQYFLSNNADRPRLREQLRAKLGELNKRIKGLRYGDTKLGLQESNDNDIKRDLDSLYAVLHDDIEPSVVKTLDSQEEADAIGKKNLLGNEIRAFVVEADDIVDDYQQLSRSQITYLRNAQVGFLLIMALSAAFIVAMIILWIRKPINEVIAGMRQIENGNFTYKLDESRGDELGMLARSYNRMAAEVKKDTEKLKKVGQELRLLSITDGLTSLYNHRYFYEILERELKRAERYKRPLSLLFMDIDYFKKYNDALGHKAGDNALKQVAKIIKNNTRKTDYAFRYGGEEFAVLLPETTQKDAFAMAQKLRKLVRELDLKTHETKGGLTISIGITTYPDHVSGSDDLVKRADEALYKAKHTGRNKTVVSEGQLIANI